MNEELPLHWVQTVQNALLAPGVETGLDVRDVPVHGSIPHVDWEKISRHIAHALELASCKIHPRPLQLLKPTEFTSGLGSQVITLPIEITPLMNKVYLLIAKDEISRLTPFLLSEGQEQKFTSFAFQEGLFYFTLQKVLGGFNECHPFKDLSFHMGMTASLPQEEAIGIDIAFTYLEQTVWTRLICPLSTHRQLKTHFASEPPPLFIHSLAKQLHVPVCLIAGTTSLSLSQFQSIRKGDFLVLDRCSFDPKTQKGTLTLTLGNTPLLRARIKEQNLKITDYAFYYEEEMPMDDDDFSEEEPLFEEDEELALPFEEGEKHLWASDEETEKEIAEEHRLENVISSKDIPLTITVEVDRLQMNLEQLLQLTPGNVLELSVHPERGVDLTIGGKKVAKGELLKLGEVLGVKILHIGNE